MGGELTALGSLVAKRQPPAQLPTTLVIKEWRTDTLTVEELWYRPGDATCCPSGVAEVTWTWRDGVPTPGPAHVLH